MTAHRLPPISLRLPADLALEVEGARLAGGHASRSSAILALVRRGLDALHAEPEDARIAAMRAAVLAATRDPDLRAEVAGAPDDFVRGAFRALTQVTLRRPDVDDVPAEVPGLTTAEVGHA